MGTTFSFNASFVQTAVYGRLRKKGHKQPYYIHLKTNKPMFFAAIGGFTGHLDRDGFVIITADAKGGMVDIHDRRPVVLTPELAREWLSAETDSAKAQAIIEKATSDADKFEWYEVDRAIGNVHNQGSELITPQKAS